MDCREQREMFNRTLCNEGKKGLSPVTRGVRLQIISTVYFFDKRVQTFPRQWGSFHNILEKLISDTSYVIKISFMFNDGQLESPCT